MNRLLFIYNPTSGTGQVKTALAQVLDVFTKAGWITTSYPTQCKGDATRTTRELAGQFDRVICAGGDGTLSEVVSGLLEVADAPPLGYIPFGSTNDCATTLRLPRKPREAALVAAGTGVAVPIDVGRLNGKPFIYVAAFGAFTKVAYDTPQELKNTFGHLAYIFAGIASLPTIAPYHMRIEYDGQFLEGDFYFGMVSNSQSIGGIRPPTAERVVLDDGEFEFTLVKKPLSLADLTDGLQALANPSVERSGALVQFQASRLTFTCDQPIPWTLDGEFGGSQPVNRVENCPKALKIIRGE